MLEGFSKDYVYRDAPTISYIDPSETPFVGIDVESGGHAFAYPESPLSDLERKLSDLHSQIVAMEDKVNMLKYISDDLETKLDSKTDVDAHEEVKRMIEELKADILEKEKSAEKKEKSPRASMICLPITKKEYNALGAAVAYLKENDTLKGICADLEDMYNRVEL